MFLASPTGRMGKVIEAGLGRKISSLGNVKFGMQLDIQVGIFKKLIRSLSEKTRNP